MKRIYITGVAGLVGSSLAREFTKLGHEVTGCDNLIGGYRDNIPKGFKWDKIDIQKYSFIKDSIDRFKPEIVVHTAALPYEGVSVFSPSLVMNNIYGGTVNTATAAIASGANKFINCSSMARYGNGEPPFAEIHKTQPQDPYGLAKVQAEQALKLLSDIHGISIINAVPHNILGTGQVYTDPYRNVAAIFTNRILLGKNPIVYGDGAQMRSFSHISSCVEAFVKLLDHEPRGIASKFETFNIGPDGNHISIKELAELVALTCGKNDMEIEYFPDRPQEVKNAYCDSSKAIKVLEYDPNKLSNIEIIKDLVQWVRDRGPQEFKYHLDIEIVREDTPKTWTEKLM